MRCSGALLVLAVLLTAPIVVAEERPLAEAEAVAPVHVIAVTGVIGPPVAEFIIGALREAHEDGAQLAVLRLDTPGGLASSMHEIISAILASPVPVATYVAPAGARAASAGTYIVYGSHVAAMAPGTHLGAATPVHVGGGLPFAPDRPSEQEDGDADRDGAERSPTAPRDAMSAKAMNDAAAFIRSLAELRGRNAEWAEAAVREAATLTAPEAHERGVVDLLAADVDELLDLMDGRRVALEDTAVVLATAAAPVRDIEPGLRTTLLAVLTNPNVAFILLMIGFYGLIFEFANPGAVVPGVLGGISLLLAFYALNVLPVNFAGVALLLLGIACMVAEAFLPSFGVLGVGGIAAFALGGFLLFDTDVPDLRVSWSVLATMTAVSAGFLIFVVGYALRAQGRPVATGIAALRRAPAIVLDWTDGAGHVRVEGERWRARGPRSLGVGAAVRVKDKDGLELVVEPTETGNGAGGS